MNCVLLSHRSGHGGLQLGYRRDADIGIPVAWAWFNIKTHGFHVLSAFLAWASDHTHGTVIAATT